MTIEPVAPTTRSTILDAAMHLFSERGYSGTTMRDIAGSVGMRAGSLYAHIDGKETLLLEIIETGIEKFLAVERLLEASDAPPEARLCIAIKSHVAIVAEDPERMLIVFHQWRFLNEPNRARAISLRRRYAQLFTRIINEGIASGVFDTGLNTRIAVFTILGALNWTPEWYAVDGALNADAIGEHMSNTLLGGLLAKA